MPEDEDDIAAGKALSYLPADDRRKALLLAEATRRFGRDGFRVADRLLSTAAAIPADDEAFRDEVRAAVGR